MGIISERNRTRKKTFKFRKSNSLCMGGIQWALKEKSERLGTMGGAVLSDVLRQAEGWGLAPGGSAAGRAGTSHVCSGQSGGCRRWGGVGGGGSYATAHEVGARQHLLREEAGGGRGVGTGRGEWDGYPGDGSVGACCGNVSPLRSHSEGLFTRRFGGWRLIGQVRVGPENMFPKCPRLILMLQAWGPHTSGKHSLGSDSSGHPRMAGLDVG